MCIRGSIVNNNIKPTLAYLLETLLKNFSSLWSTNSKWTLVGKLFCVSLISIQTIVPILNYSSHIRIDSPFKIPNSNNLIF